ncbi:MAG: O-antigen ligase family protein [Chitinophagales bacterium]|nr:O-antigen ligase family protein [Chitinophagales bacterium]MDW8393282.1 O-antigen ligase family protein [Chitinophagales bacterium]
MWAPLRHADWQAVPVLCLAAMIGGLFTVYAMSSIAIIVWCAYVLLASPVQTFRSFFSDRLLMLLTLVFFIYLFSGLNSTKDPSFYQERLRIKLPFLALPVCFAGLKNRLLTRQVYALLYLFVFLSVLTALQISLNVMLHEERLLRMYEMGQMPETPFHHTRYSLMVAFAFLAVLYLWQKNYVLRYRWERPLQLVAAAFLFFFLHLLAVRSGLLALYLCLIYLLLRSIWQKKNFLHAVAALLVLVLLPVLAYVTIPTLRAKVAYMRYDVSRLLSGQLALNYSDGGRVASILAGWQLFQENWLTGTGIGDLKVEMTAKLGSDAMAQRLALPHNQFVFVAAGTGIVGLLVFTLAVMLPLIVALLQKNWLFVCFNIIVLSSFLSEATVEEQIGTVFYLLFLLLEYIYLIGNNK